MERDYLLTEPTLARLIEEVCAKHGVTRLDMTSARRDKKISWARFEYFYRARHETGMSLPAIGRACGHRDHTTVMHGIKRHALRFVEAV